jgi:hypothetical protein
MEHGVMRPLPLSPTGTRMPGSRADPTRRSATAFSLSWICRAARLDLTPEDPDRAILRERGWLICDAQSVAGTPWDYHSYIRHSLGEFSCAKPSCMRLQNAWVSDRTLCYLASGKPVVVQHTGPSRILPDAAGIFRFHTLDQAATAIHRVLEDYSSQCRVARDLAEEYFDARKVVRRVLEVAI